MGIDSNPYYYRNPICLFSLPYDTTLMFGESNPAFRAECPNCGFEESGRSFEDVAAVISKHHEHTGHEMEWKESDFSREQTKREIYTVICDACTESWRFHSLSEAEKFREEHGRYTNHTVSNEPVSETIERASVRNLPNKIDNIKNIINILDRGKGRGVPESVVVGLFEDENISSVKDRLRELKKSGQIYEPKIGHIRTVEEDSLDVR